GTGWKCRLRRLEMSVLFQSRDPAVPEVDHRLLEVPAMPESHAVLDRDRHRTRDQARQWHCEGGRDLRVLHLPPRVHEGASAAAVELLVWRRLPQLRRRQVGRWRREPGLLSFNTSPLET